MITVSPLGVSTQNRIQKSKATNLHNYDCSVSPSFQGKYNMKKGIIPPFAFFLYYPFDKRKNKANAENVPETKPQEINENNINDNRQKNDYEILYDALEDAKEINPELTKTLQHIEYNEGMCVYNDLMILHIVSANENDSEYAKRLSLFLNHNCSPNGISIKDLNYIVDKFAKDEKLATSLKQAYPEFTALAIKMYDTDKELLEKCQKESMSFIQITKIFKDKYNLQMD